MLFSYIIGNSNLTQKILKLAYGLDLARSGLQLLHIDTPGIDIETYF